MRLVLVRHAESTANAEGRWQGHENFALSEGGRAQAEVLHARFREEGFQPTHVYTSPLRRAAETAEIVARSWDVAIEPWDDLKEHDVGVFSGLTWDEIGNHGGATPHHKFWVAPASHRPPGGESFLEVIERVGAVIARLTAAHGGHNIIAVAHGGSIRAALAHALGLDPEVALGFAADTMGMASDFGIIAGDFRDGSDVDVFSFSITPDLYDIVTGHVRTNQIYGVPLMELRPQLMAPWESAVKRLMDIAVALLVLVGLAPLWLLVAAAIRLDSRGPILFRQERVGREGKTFTMYKFRSMVLEAEQETGPTWVKDADPRVTRVGRALRALHLDEIPQCLNFLRGDMSLVGPRPERPFFVDRFAQDIPFYMRRFNVKPGLLGWAQSKHEFDMQSTDFAPIAAERLEYDLYYIENASLMLDFTIMIRTIWFVLAGKSTR